MAEGTDPSALGLGNQRDREERLVQDRLQIGH
jgi:hypothetical protein